ncbi:MAG: DUF559 domain-containing protein [Thermoplasmata archaeon]|nr:DUF559 domain-containing protein [Thermoplasmata archaeon]
MELDGSIHNETKDHDQFRDEEMRYKGLHVLRLKNEELSDMYQTLEKIRGFFIFNTLISSILLSFNSPSLRSREGDRG